jgi:hypothetical protein
MDHEIHIYVGTACISKKSSYKYPIGEKHAFLFYLKEKDNSEYNPAKAKKLISNRGFDEIEFSRAGKVSLEKIGTGDNKEYYDNAVTTGSTFILYTDPIQ